MLMPRIIFKTEIDMQLTLNIHYLLITTYLKNIVHSCILIGDWMLVQTKSPYLGTLKEEIQVTNFHFDEMSTSCTFPLSLDLNPNKIAEFGFFTKKYPEFVLYFLWAKINSSCSS